MATITVFEAFIGGFLVAVIGVWLLLRIEKWRDRPPQPIEEKPKRKEKPKNDGLSPPPLMALSRESIERAGPPGGTHVSE